SKSLKLFPANLPQQTGERFSLLFEPDCTKTIRTQEEQLSVRCLLPRDKEMNLHNYLFLITMEHAYLLVRPEDVQAISPVDPDTKIPVVFSSTLHLTQHSLSDSSGNAWIPLEEDCQAPEFIIRLADHLRTFPHQIRERIT